MKTQWIILGTFAVSIGLFSASGADKAPSAKSEATSLDSSFAGNAKRHAALVRVGESRYGWKWLAAKFDKDGDQVVSRQEFGGSKDDFARLDRTWDGSLTAEDFDWSTDGTLCRQKETTFALFKSTDTDSNGRITTEEWQALFAKLSKDKGYLSEEQLEELIYLPRVMKTRKETQNFASIAEFLDDAKANFNPKLPGIGDLAPDFELKTADGETSVRLSSFRGKKPVVLIFGCFSCGNYRTYSETLEEMYRQRQNDVEFLRVYVREAHPTDARAGATETNSKANILVKQPATLAERCSVAGQCSATLNIKGPLVVDELDNKVGRTYGGWPDRLYLIDREGRVAFRSAPGPFGFNPRELEQSLVLLQSDE